MTRRARPAEEAGPALRWLRAGLLAAATLGVASWAHASADGNLPGGVGLGAIWLLATAVAAGLLARPASSARILTMVVAGQFGLHLLLSLLAGHGPAAAPSAAARHYAATSMLAEGATGQHAGGDATALTDGLGALLAELTSAEGLRMTAAHLAAAGVVGLWLATGERILWGCLRRIAYAAGTGLADALRVLLLAWPGAPTTRPVGEPGWCDRPVDRRAVDWLTATPRRGPPVVSSC